jgi:NAD(P)-dependent dehydrogenase (short-subunit alcohol dehydrogenase family)
VHGLRLDVTDRGAFERAADEAERVFGKVHVLSANAGVGILGRSGTRNTATGTGPWG